MRRHAPTALILLSAVYLGLGLWVVLVTPYNSFPDEGSHFGYAKYLRMHGRLPPLSFNTREILIPEGFQPPLYYAMGAALLIPPFSSETQVLLLRLLSLLLGWGTVILVWKCAACVFPERPHAVMLATGFAALNPQFIFTHAGITNISATDFTCGLTQLVLLRILSDRSSLLRKSVMLGVCCGLALLSRATTVFLVPLCLAVLWHASRSEEGRTLPRLLLAFSAAAFAVAGWWCIRNWIYFGDPFLWKLHQSTVGAHWARDGGADLLYVAQSLAFLHASFWAYFGRNEFHAGIVEYAVYLLIEAIAAWGLVEILRRKEDDPDFQPPAFSRDAFRLQVICAVLLLAEILALQLRLSSTQGRYLYMAMPANGILLSAGIYKALPRRNRHAGAILVSAFLLLMCVYLLVRFWFPHYA